MKKKLLSAILAGVILSMSLLSACSSGTDSGTDTSTNAGDTSTNAGDTVEVSQALVRTTMPSEPDNLDPWLSAASDTGGVMSNVFEGLLNYDENGALIGGIASEYTVSGDGLVYTFKIRDDILWHDGTALTMEDVIYTYNRFTGLDGQEKVTSKFDIITSIADGGNNDFVVTIAEPSAVFASLNIMAVLPEGYDDQGTKPIGTGPYKFVEYTPSQRIVFELNKDYYNEDRMGTIDRVEVYIMTDTAAIVSALLAGQLDFAAIDGANVEAVEGEFVVEGYPQNMVQLMALNNSFEPLSNVKVRQAINYAIDKQDIIDGAFNGYATELYTNFSPVMGHFYNAELESYYKTNIDTAKQLMSEAGYADGFDLEITVPSNYAAHVTSAQIIAQQLAAININVTINPIEWATWLDVVYTNADYEATVVGLTGKLDPDAILYRFESSYSRNFMKYNNPTYDTLIANAKVELDDATRVDMYKDCQEILTEEAVSVFISDPNAIIAMRPNLKGYTKYPVTFTDFSTLYFVEQ